MTSPSKVIPAQAVEAAAKMSHYIETGKQWEALAPERQRELLSKTYSILEAAAPHIRAQVLEEVAAEVDEGVQAHGQEEYADWLRARAETERPTP